MGNSSKRRHNILQSGKLPLYLCIYDYVPGRLSVTGPFLNTLQMRPFNDRFMEHKHFHSIVILGTANCHLLEMLYPFLVLGNDCLLCQVWLCTRFKLTRDYIKSVQLGSKWPKLDRAETNRVHADRTSEVCRDKIKLTWIVMHLTWLHSNFHYLDRSKHQEKPVKNQISFDQADLYTQLTEPDPVDFRRVRKNNNKMPATNQLSLGKQFRISICSVRHCRRQTEIFLVCVSKTSVPIILWSLVLNFNRRSTVYKYNCWTRYTVCVFNVSALWTDFVLQDDSIIDDGSQG